MSEALKQGERPSWIKRYPLKGWATYLMILTIVSLLLFSVKLTCTVSMVIYAQQDKQDFLQVFFPVAGAYSEENSERSESFEKPTNGIEIKLPLSSLDRVRIDPSNHGAEIVITKIELRHLFGKKILMPSDLLANVKPIQMIDKIEVTPAGLLVRSTGNDPAFELQLNSSFVPFTLMILTIISVLLSLAVFLGIKKFTYLKMPTINSNVYLFIIPFLISIAIAALFYPGFMSYDTLHALRSARNEVIESQWPPMVSYVWRAVDLISLNPAAMHFSQVFLLLFSIYFVVYFFTKKISYATTFVLAYLCIPVVLGTVAVIWKDVLMAAFFMAGFAVILAMKQITNKWYFTFLSLLALFLIFLGVCTRHNAILGAVPLIFYLAFIIASRLFKTRSYLLIALFLLGSALTGGIFITKNLLDNYSLPNLVKMKSSTDDFIQLVRVLDVAGASLCVGSNLFADIAPNLTIDEIRNGYDAKHANLSRGLLDRVLIDSRINKIWFNVAINHPVCFFANKFDIAKYLLGANSGEQFLITAPAIDNNEFGYNLNTSSLRDASVNYISFASNITLLKPWFIYLISIGLMIYMLRIREISLEHFTLYLSAVLYFAGLVGFGNAADARLPFYSTSVFLLSIYISALNILRTQKIFKLITIGK